MVLAGDVGSGKTELAETIGDAVARQEKIDISLFPLSLSTRGQGRVGEMTQLLSAAFDYTVAEATRLKSATGRARGAVILLVDEADALAQSREPQAASAKISKSGAVRFMRASSGLMMAGFAFEPVNCAAIRAFDAAVGFDRQKHARVAVPGFVLRAGAMQRQIVRGDNDGVLFKFAHGLSFYL